MKGFEIYKLNIDRDGRLKLNSQKEQSHFWDHPRPPPHRQPPHLRPLLQKHLPSHQCQLRTHRHLPRHPLHRRYAPLYQGFGLFFGYHKRLTWSSLGFAFLITALCIEFYPLFNAFWIKAGIEDNPTKIGFDNKDFTLLLSNFDVPTGANYSNTITTAFRCALSMMAAFSCILGRAGSLECLILSIVGMIGFELNRQIIVNLATDSFGTFSIFTFGGFLGLTVAYLLKRREDSTDGCSTLNNPKNTASPGSVALSTLGAIIIFLFFPLLTYELDAYHGINTHSLYIGPLELILSMGCAIIAASGTSLLINGALVPRDLITSPVAGAIIAGSATFYFAQNAYCFVLGIIGGVVQVIIQNLIEKANSRNGSVLSTFSWSLFGIQGLLGGVAATIFKKVNDTDSDGITFSAASTDFNAGYELLIAIISAGMGIGFGLIAGIPISLVNAQTADGHFEDGEYWLNSDSISYPKEERIEVHLEGKGIPPQPRGPIEDEEDVVFEDIASDVKDSHAYL